MSNYKPDISVILPTYNHVNYLPLAIAGICNQDFSGKYELIIVNDASTDDTQGYLSTLRLDNCIIVRHESNKRLPTALNTGLAHARGEYVTWISSDNITLPNFLSALYQALKARPDCGFAYSAFEVIDAVGEVKSVFKNQDFTYPNLLRGNPGCASFMYYRSLHNLVGQYDPALEGAEDWDMWLRILERTRAVYTDKITYKYRLHDDSLTAMITQKIMTSSIKAVANAFARAGGYFDLSRLYPDFAECANVKQAWHDAFADFSAKILTSIYIDPRNAFQYINNALKINPNCLVTQFNKLVAYQRSNDLPQAYKQLTIIKNAVRDQAALAPLLKQIVKALESEKWLRPLFLPKAQSELLSKPALICA